MTFSSTPETILEPHYQAREQGCSITVKVIEERYASRGNVSVLVEVVQSSDWRVWAVGERFVMTKRMYNQNKGLT